MHIYVYDCVLLVFVVYAYMYIYMIVCCWALLAYDQPTLLLGRPSPAWCTTGQICSNPRRPRCVAWPSSSNAIMAHCVIYDCRLSSASDSSLRAAHPFESRLFIAQNGRRRLAWRQLAYREPYCWSFHPALSTPNYVWKALLQNAISIVPKNDFQMSILGLWIVFWKRVLYICVQTISHFCSFFRKKNSFSKY